MNAPLPNPFQNNGHWLADRTGCLTASRMADALDFTKAGKPGARRTALLKAIAAERMTGLAARTKETDAMRHGTAMEPVARAAYEEATGNIVRLVGFIPHPSIDWCGCSPDGLIGSDGLIEIKAPETTTHLDYIASGVVPPAYKPQMTLQCAVTGRRFVDFVSFDDRVKNERKRLFVRRFTPTAEEIELIETAVRDFLLEVEQLLEAIDLAEQIA